MRIKFGRGCTALIIPCLALNYVSFKRVLRVGVVNTINTMSSSFDKTLETLDPHDARKWQEFKNGDWKE